MLVSPVECGCHPWNVGVTRGMWVSPVECGCHPRNAGELEGLYSVIFCGPES